jgi:hypothetical protein
MQIQLLTHYVVYGIGYGFKQFTKNHNRVPFD